MNFNDTDDGTRAERHDAWLKAYRICDECGKPTVYQGTSLVHVDPAWPPHPAK